MAPCTDGSPKEQQTNILIKIKIFFLPPVKFKLLSQISGN